MGIGWGFLATPVPGAVLRVPSEHPTINAALDAAAPGDSVLVAPGVYDEYETRLLSDGIWYSSIAFLRSGVAIVSEAGPSSTVLRMDSTVAAPCILRAFGESGDILVSGFTITGAVGSVSGVQFGYGGRLTLRDCEFRELGSAAAPGNGIGSVRVDLTVLGCRFEQIHSNWGGGAIAQTSGTLLVEDSSFLDCRSGAIQVVYDSGFPHATGLTIRRSFFADNVKTNGAGGAVIAGGYSNVLIEDCCFERNRANGGGGAVAGGGPSSPQVTVRRCVFLDNVTGAAGGAIATSAMSAIIEDNTVIGSITEHPQVFGASAIALTFSGTRVLRRNVVVGSIGDEAVYALPDNLTEGCNVFWNNASGNTQGFTPSPTDLEADPLFCDPGGADFRVSAGSPCLPGNGHPSCTEPIGALDEGCGTIAVTPETWGKIKGQYRGEGQER